MAGRDWSAAMPALAALEQVGNDRDVLQRADRMLAMRACGARREEIVARPFGELLATQLGALIAPALLEHLRQPVDHDVQKAADTQAHDRGNHAPQSRHCWKTRELVHQAIAKIGVRLDLSNRPRMAMDRGG